MKIQRLGIDIGGVIIDRVNDGTDTSFFSSNYLRTTAVPGAIEIIARLVAEKFGPENVLVVSKCGPAIEAKTREWLAHHGFYEATGIRPEQIFFCRARSDKAGICKKLGITHFVDDRIEVLGYLEGIVSKRFLFNSSEKENARYQQFLPGVTRVASWEEIFQHITK